jgi:hypothetical protein
MSGAELALAIVPLVIVLVEHHRTVIRRGKAVTLSRISNDQQLDFYQELHAELSLLNVTLDRVKAVCVKTGLSRARPEESEEVLIDIALGDRAPDFKQILDRVMKSINDLVREKSSVLTRDDTVCACCQDHSDTNTGQTNSSRVINAPCSKGLNSLRNRLQRAGPRNRCARSSVSPGTKRLVMWP